MVGYSAFTLDFLPGEYRSNWPRTIVDLGLFTVGGLIVAIALSGGRTFVLRGITVSATRLYTPMLVFSVLLILRWAVTTRPRVSNPSHELGGGTLHAGWHGRDSGGIDADAVGVHLAIRVSAGGQPCPHVAQQRAWC